MPKPTVDLWNLEKEVTFGVFSKATTCGAHWTKDCSEDYPACALTLADCTTGTHKAGRAEGESGKKAKKKTDAVVMEMPAEGDFLAILVPVSSNATLFMIGSGSALHASCLMVLG